MKRYNDGKKTVITWLGMFMPIALVVLSLGQCNETSECQGVVNVIEGALEENSFEPPLEITVEEMESGEPYCTVEVPLVVDGFYGAPSMRNHMLLVEVYRKPDLVDFSARALMRSSIETSILGDYMRSYPDSTEGVSSTHYWQKIGPRIVTYSIFYHRSHDPEVLPIAHKLFAALEAHFNREE